MKSKYAKEITFEPSIQTIYPNEDKTAQFAKSYNWLTRRRELSPGAKHTYNALTQHAGSKNYARVKEQTLALETGVSDRQIRRYIEELEHFGLIKVQQIGLTKSNVYYFLDHPWKYEEVRVSKLKQPYPTVNKQDNNVSDRTHMSAQERTHTSAQERPYMSVQERSDTSAPLNRSSEKIPLKEHTQKRESVCVVSPTELSAYSEEQWLIYAERQKNINSASALANSLAKSKKSDHLMRKFLQSLEQEKQNASKAVLETQERALKLEREKYILVKQLLALNEPLLDWQIQFVQDNRHLLSNQQFC